MPPRYFRQPYPCILEITLCTVPGPEAKQGAFHNLISLDNRTRIVRNGSLKVLPGSFYEESNSLRASSMNFVSAGFMPPPAK